MNEQEQRIAIAEDCGWKHLNRPSGIMLAPNGHSPEYDYPPDYLHDLNAMHEAEKSLTPKQEVLYIDVLSKSMAKGNLQWLSELESCYRATAAQRAEAFLRTIGKWTDD